MANPISARIMAIVKDNTMAAIILTGVAQDKIAAVLDNFERLKITRDMVNCFWTHECNSCREKFDEFAAAIKARPTGCVAGCIWEPVEKDETDIFGPKLPLSHTECAMADCDTPSVYYCSACYCVRYCTPLHQRLDHPRHMPECKRVVQVVTILKSLGEAYAKRTLKNNISISDIAWSKLWAKYGAK